MSFQSRAGRTTSPRVVQRDHAVLLAADGDRGDVVEQAAGEADSSAAAQTRVDLGAVRMRRRAGRTTCPVSASQTRTLVDWVEQSMPATRVLMRSILRHRAPAVTPAPDRPPTRAGTPAVRPAGAGRSTAGPAATRAGPAGYPRSPDPATRRAGPAGHPPRRIGRLHAQLGAGLVHERRGGGADRRVVPVDAGVEDEAAS